LKGGQPKNTPDSLLPIIRDVPKDDEVVVDSNLEKTKEISSDVNPKPQKYTDKRSNLTDKRSNLTDKRSNLTDKRSNLTDKRSNLTDKRDNFIDKRPAKTESLPVQSMQNTAVPYIPITTYAQPAPNPINTLGPFGNNVQLNKFWENMLPRGLYGKTFNFKTLTSRWTLYDFVKQTFNAADGENMGFDMTGNCSNLLSYIKLVDMNPTYYSLTNLNPWEALPYGLIINQGCYPPVFIQKNQSTGCAQNTIGLNIRIYALSRAEYCAYQYRSRLTTEYDVWRELEYYKYVKNVILRNRTPQSPNFPMLYAYYFANNQSLDYLGIKRRCLTQTQLMAKEFLNFELRFTIDFADPNLNLSLGQLPPVGSIHPDLTRPLTIEPGESSAVSLAYLPDEIDPWLSMYSGQMLTVVTEAYHYNFYQWASRQYENRGVVEKMTATGFYDKSIWLSVYFQIIQALYTLQVNGIYIRDMTLEDNVYIMDLQITDRSRGYWEYIVDGISYYVPNFGYMVMIDTNYKDINMDPTMNSVDCNGKVKRQYKIYTHDIFGKGYPMKGIQHYVYENYKSIVNINCFTDTYTRNMVNRPPPEIMELLQQMSADPEENLGVVLRKYFPMFMNNRIGSFVKPDVETPNLRDINLNSLAVGDMVAEVVARTETGVEICKWAMVSKILADNKVEIITRPEPKSANFITKEILSTTLRRYIEAGRIEQNQCFGLYYSFEELIETYYLNSPIKLTTC
jgi:hypothetical protein